MGYLDYSTACDKNDCGSCPGYVSVIDQDGNSRYVCKHACHQRKREAMCKDEGHDIPSKLEHRCACCGTTVTYKPEKKARPRARVLR